MKIASDEDLRWSRLCRGVHGDSSRGSFGGGCSCPACRDAGCQLTRDRAIGVPLPGAVGADGSLLDARGHHSAGEAVDRPDFDGR